MKIFQKANCLLLLFALSSVSLQAQTGSKKSTSTSVNKKTNIVPPPPPPAEIVDPILMTVGGDPVTKGEFESIYRNKRSKNSRCL
jgi:hypothetical protein